jgi:hypothetical protein
MRNNIFIAKAVAALETSVGSIIDCDESDATKREELAETFTQFQSYMEHNGVGTDVAKADRSGPHSLAAALLDHLHDRLERRREQHGYQKSAKESPPMTSHNEFVQSVVKQYGIVALAKSMVQDQKSYGLDEHTFTSLATEHAQRLYPNDRPDSAFSKLYQSEESVRRACALAKSMPFVVSLEPVQVGGEDAQAVNDPAKAIEQLKQLGRDRWPTASAADQFERALTALENHKLARVAVPIPRPTTIYQMPHR